MGSEDSKIEAALHKLNGQIRRLKYSALEETTDPSLGGSLLDTAMEHLEASLEDLSAAQEEITQQNEVLEQEREQRILAEALLATARALNSTLDLEEILAHILANVGRVLPHDAANIMLLRDGIVGVAGSDGYSPHHADRAMRALYLDYASVEYLQRLARAGQPVITAEPGHGSHWTGVPQMRWVRSCAGAPIIVEGEVLGFLNLDSASPGAFSPTDAERLKLFVDQAALAIRNARTYQDRRTIAALEERQKLARDLHDTVAQTLWSACLMTELLAGEMAQKGSECKGSIQELSRLIHNALFEMRALLLEMRPETMAKTRLEELLAHFIADIQSRMALPITLKVSGIDCLSPEMRFTLFRVIQEAFNNALHHANAQHIEVSVHYEADRVILQVSDDGCGFDARSISAGQGLSIIKERIQQIGGEVCIRSQPGAGTQIEMNCPLAPSGAA